MRQLILFGTKYAMERWQRNTTLGSRLKHNTAGSFVAGTQPGDTTMVTLRVIKDPHDIERLKGHTYDMVTVDPSLEDTASYPLLETVAHHVAAMGRP